MNINKDTKYAIAVLTSMGVRITPENGEPVHTSSHYLMQATSAETNVVNVFTSLGLSGLAMTNFIEGSPVSAFIKAKLRERGITYIGNDVPQGGPWGYRHQFNIADSGNGLRAPRVWNDRAGEVGRTLSVDDFDLDVVFTRDRVGILHISGLIAAMSEQTTEACIRLANIAKERGAVVSFDLNYRATFWQGREEELRSAFRNIASHADILIGNEEDFQLCLGMKGPEAGGKDLGNKLGNFKSMIMAAHAEYPSVKVFATTLREVITANEHLWGALLYDGEKWCVEMPRRIPVLDRIGGGDAFTGGLLYGLYQGWESSKCLQFGWATGALTVSGLMDYAEPADERQVWDIYHGNARVQR